LQLALVGRHQGAIRVKVKRLRFGIEGQRIQFAAKGLGVSQRATCVSKVIAMVLDAYASQAFFLLLG
jgi:hypothetical protein